MGYLLGYLGFIVVVGAGLGLYTWLTRPRPREDSPDGDWMGGNGP
jgi:hypothetical protein